MTEFVTSLISNPTLLWAVFDAGDCELKVIQIPFMAIMRSTDLKDQSTCIEPYMWSYPNDYGCPSDNKDFITYIHGPLPGEFDKYLKKNATIEHCLYVAKKKYEEKLWLKRIVHNDEE